MDTFEIRNLTFFYPNEQSAALTNVTLDIKQGEFLVLCGPSGCGKSTLLRQLKADIAPHGEKSGEILFEGHLIENLTPRERAAKIGFVMQSTENQIVTDKVWHELSFGLESLGFGTPVIRRKVAEMASFLGIEGWFYKNVSELSGGQKQLLNLASVMLMQPSVLILDEPTSQLDPIAASEFLSTLSRINRELGTTVILTEHRLDDALSYADRAAVMDSGELLFSGTPKEVAEKLKQVCHPMFLSMPSPMRIWANVKNELPCPVTVSEGRKWLNSFSKSHNVQASYEEKSHVHGEEVLSLSDVWFKYEKDSPDVLKGLSLSVSKGEFFSILGGNGTGKSTALSLMAGLNAPYRGKASHNGKIVMLPQNPQALFIKKTVREDLWEITGRKEDETLKEKFEHIVSLCRLDSLLERHPYDLSGGEQQRAALAKVLLLSPDILLLDEPTKGLDADFKQDFANIIDTLTKSGVTVVMVSHDIEFCARASHRCALFFDGNIAAFDTPRKFFSGNSFYTTSSNRMARDILPEAITDEDVILSCGAVPHNYKPLKKDMPKPKTTLSDPPKKVLPLWRKIIAASASLIALIAFIISIQNADLSEIIGPEGLTPVSGDYIALYCVLIASLFILALALGNKRNSSFQRAHKKEKLPKRTVAAAIMILLLIPITLFIGVYCFEGRSYYFTALLILLEAAVPFVLIFESRRPRARELALIAALCAIGVAGRAALFMLPNFKPVMALTIIAGAALGGEAGFFVGATTMLVSNIMFSQGPWTPWQMFAMGIIGFLSGMLVKSGLLSKSRISLTVFGALCAIIIYGGIMNPASALMWQHDITPKVILAYYISGFPIDLIHAAATALFLWFTSEPMLEKLERIKLKYGLIKT